MKILVALLGSVVSVALACAQTATEKTKSGEPTPPAKNKIVIRLDPEPKASTKDGAAKSTKSPATKAGEKGAKKEEPPPKIEGMEIARPDDKGLLGLQVVDSTFKLSFYDAKKKPKAPDVAYAVLRWNPIYQRAEERVVLNPGEKALTSPRNVRPPYNFKLYMTLFAAPAEGADPVVSESYVVDFKQEGP